MLTHALEYPRGQAFESLPAHSFRRVGPLSFIPKGGSVTCLQWEGNRYWNLLEDPQIAMCYDNVAHISAPPNEEYFLLTFFGFLVVGLYFPGRLSQAQSRRGSKSRRPHPFGAQRGRWADSLRRKVSSPFIYQPTGLHAMEGCQGQCRSGWRRHPPWSCRSPRSKCAYRCLCRSAGRQS